MWNKFCGILIAWKRLRSMHGKIQGLKSLVMGNKSGKTIGAVKLFCVKAKKLDKLDKRIAKLQKERAELLKDEKNK